MTEVATRSPAEAPTRFTRAAVEELSSRNAEPAWLTARRLESFATFDRLPVPPRTDEDYRRTDLRRLRLSDFAPANGSTSAEIPESIRALFGDEGADAGRVVSSGGATLDRALRSDLAGQGVIFCGLDEAVKNHPDLVRPYLTDARIGADEDKWSAMNGAFWSGGAFLYIPEGVQIDLPLRSMLVQDSAGSASFPRTLIVAEPWSQVTYIDDSMTHDGSTDAGLNAAVIDLVAKEGSSVRFCHIQQLGTGVWNFERQRVFAHRDAAVNLLQVALGSRLTKSYVHAHMDEPGVSAELLGLVFVGGKQHVDHSTLQNHRAGHCMSDLLFKCAMLEQARSVYSGLISIAPGAQRSDAYQNNRNLLLSGLARADSIPMLEILANDVRCTHGSTTSSVDEEELFYLQSRGLPLPEAERLIVEGFFSPVLDRIPLEDIRERLKQAIEAHINRMAWS